MKWEADIIPGIAFGLIFDINRTGTSSIGLAFLCFTFALKFKLKPKRS